MTDDVRISVSLKSHRKTKRLKRALGAEGCWGLVCLFAWAGSERWTGDLSGLTDDDIEEEADWEGARGSFVEALLDVGFLEGEPMSRRIHDWKEHNPYASGKGDRIKKAKEAANKRWAKSNEINAAGCYEHATSMQLASSSIAPEQCPPAPAPAPAQTKAVASPSGSRLPDDWTPPEDWLAWARSEKPGINALQEADKFRDFWHSKAGKDGRKANWQATWRNWIRNSRPTIGYGNSGYGSNGSSEPVRRRNEL